MYTFSIDRICDNRPTTSSYSVTTTLATGGAMGRGSTWSRWTSTSTTSFFIARCGAGLSFYIQSFLARGILDKILLKGLHHCPRAGY